VTFTYLYTDEIVEQFHIINQLHHEVWLHMFTKTTMVQLAKKQVVTDAAGKHIRALETRNQEDDFFDEKGVFIKHRLNCQFVAAPPFPVGLYSLNQSFMDTRINLWHTSSDDDHVSLRKVRYCSYSSHQSKAVDTNNSGHTLQGTTIGLKGIYPS
jgi:hypothetical protein